MASRRYNFLRQILPWPSAKSHLRLQEHGKKDSTPFSFYLPSFLALFVRALWCKQRRLFSSHFGKGTWGSCRAVDNGDVIHFSRSVLRSSLPPSLSLFPSLSPSLPPSHHSLPGGSILFPTHIHLIAFLSSEPILPPGSPVEGLRGLWERSHLRPLGQGMETSADKVNKT